MEKNKIYEIYEDFESYWGCPIRGLPYEACIDCLLMNEENIYVRKPKDVDIEKVKDFIMCEAKSKLKFVD